MLELQRVLLRLPGRECEAVSSHRKRRLNKNFKTFLYCLSSWAALLGNVCTLSSFCGGEGYDFVSISVKNILGSRHRLTLLNGSHREAHQRTLLPWAALASAGPWLVVMHGRCTCSVSSMQQALELPLIWIVVVELIVLERTSGRLSIKASSNDSAILEQTLYMVSQSTICMRLLPLSELSKFLSSNFFIWSYSSHAKSRIPCNKIFETLPFDSV